MKKGSRLLSILIAVIMITAPLVSFAAEEGSFDAPGNGVPAAASAGQTGRTGQDETPGSGSEAPDSIQQEPAEVTVVDSVEEFSEESEAAFDNEAFFTIDTSKDASAELATDEVSEEVTDILSGDGSAAEKQSGIVDALEDSGLYRAEETGESKVDVTSKFAYQRLRLIAPQEEVFNAYGATKAVYFEDSYYLSYDSMEATMQAYEALASEYGEDSVFIDTPMKLSSGEKGWGAAFMRMDEHKILPGNDAAVTVAVVDSGIQRSHPIFSGKTILKGKNFVKNDGGSSADPVDDNGHGTAVSGIIAESTPSNVKIMPLKAMDANGEGSEFDVMSAIRYADEQGADIINLSLGGYLDYSEMAGYEEEFSSYDALVVCAAGNENVNMDAAGVHEFPGEISSTVCVGSISKNRKRSYFSNYGKALDFTAPGSSITLAAMGGSYRTESGTSFSSPYLAAAAALVKAGHENYSNGQIISYLKNISEDLGAPGRDIYYGSGCPRFPGETDPEGNTALLEKSVTKLPSLKSTTPTVRLSKKVFTWNGKVQTPSIAVYDGTTRLDGSQYSVSYSGGRRNVGKYSIKVTFKNKYYEESTVTYRIIPKGTRISKVKGAKKAVNVRWARQSSRMSRGYIKGYQIQLSTDPDFKKNVKKVTVRGYKNTSKKVSGLKAKRKYYVRIRTYRTVGEKNYYSLWSAARKVKTR